MQDREVVANEITDILMILSAFKVIYLYCNVFT